MEELEKDLSSNEGDSVSGSCSTLEGGPNTPDRTPARRSSEGNVVFSCHYESSPRFRRRSSHFSVVSTSSGAYDSSIDDGKAMRVLLKQFMKDRPALQKTIFDQDDREDALFTGIQSPQASASGYSSHGSSRRASLLEAVATSTSSGEFPQRRRSLLDVLTDKDEPPAVRCFEGTTVHDLGREAVDVDPLRGDISENSISNIVTCGNSAPSSHTEVGDELRTAPDDAKLKNTGQMSSDKTTPDTTADFDGLDSNSSCNELTAPINGKHPDLLDSSSTVEVDGQFPSRQSVASEPCLQSGEITMQNARQRLLSLLDPAVRPTPAKLFESNILIADNSDTPLVDDYVNEFLKQKFLCRPAMGVPYYPIEEEADDASNESDANAMNTSLYERGERTDWIDIDRKELASADAIHAFLFDLPGLEFVVTKRNSYKDNFHNRSQMRILSILGDTISNIRPKGRIVSWSRSFSDLKSVVAGDACFTLRFQHYHAFTYETEDATAIVKALTRRLCLYWRMMRSRMMLSSVRPLCKADSTSEHASHVEPESKRTVIPQIVVSVTFPYKDFRTTIVVGANHTVGHIRKVAIAKYERRMQEALDPNDVVVLLPFDVLAEQAACGDALGVAPRVAVHGTLKCSMASHLNQRTLGNYEGYNALQPSEKIRHYIGAGRGGEVFPRPVHVLMVTKRKSNMARQGTLRKIEDRLGGWRTASAGGGGSGVDLSAGKQTRRGAVEGMLHMSLQDRLALIVAGLIEEDESIIGKIERLQKLLFPVATEPYTLRATSTSSSTGSTSHLTIDLSSATSVEDVEEDNIDDIDLGELREAISMIHAEIFDSYGLYLNCLATESQISEPIESICPEAFLMEEHPCVSETIEMILQRLIVGPVYRRLYSSCQRKMDRPELDLECVELANLREQSQDFFGIREPHIREHRWRRTREKLNSVDSAILPRDKLNAVVTSIRVLHDEFVEGIIGGSEDDNTISGDDLLAIYIYVVLHSTLRSPLAMLDFMWTLSHPDHVIGEVGYYLTVLNAAIEYLANVAFGGDSSSSSRRSSFAAASMSRSANSVSRAPSDASHVAEGQQLR
eukprot:Rmarinus@m.30066